MVGLFLWRGGCFVKHPATFVGVVGDMYALQDGFVGESERFHVTQLLEHRVEQASGVDHNYGFSIV